MTETRRLKKSETLEVRLPYPTKVAFMERCQADGANASEAVRGFIEAYVAPAPVSRGRKIPPLRWAAGGLAAAAVVAVAAPSLAAGFAAVAHGEVPRGVASAQAFDRADLNHDGQLSRDEYRRALAR